ncbi:outer membrane protein assembly factor BamB family protein [Micromonospora sp. CPCC 206061]|uniref:outer membrane protein assembly factor BamB family protein n=1 Tax=Micromonospora sp. CPCC 206061 TaxID=3122410 RepID=UPI002FF238DC
MSTDLERMFTALGRDADGIPLGDPSTARHRGERRRRTQLVAAGLATAGALAAGLTGGSWLARDAAGPEPVAPPPDGPVQLGPARPLGKEIRYGDQQVRFGLTAIAGNRAYAGWQEEDGTLRVAAADLETGKAAWPARTLGEFDDSNGIIAVPQALLAIGEHNDGTVPDQLLYVVDPDTGRVRWELPFDMNGDDLLFYDSALVHVTEAGAISARDWSTGRVVWDEAPPADPPVASLGMYGPADPLPGSSNGAFPAHLSDPRMLQITAGGALVVRDSATGAVRSTRPGVGIGADAHYLAYDGRLFGAHRGTGPNRVVVAEVDGGGAARELHKAASGRSYYDLAPCGSDRICLLDGGATEAPAEIAAVDVASGLEIWRKQAPAGAQRLLPSGARVLVTGSGAQPDEMSSALFDHDGTQLLGEEDRRASLAWVSTGTLLSFGGGKLAGVTAADGSRQELGDSPLEGLMTPRFCSWTERRLACPGSTGFRVWDIASR